MLNCSKRLATKVTKIVLNQRGAKAMIASFMLIIVFNENSERFQFGNGASLRKNTIE